MTNIGREKIDILKDYIKKQDMEPENLENLPKTKPIIISLYAEKGGVGKTTVCMTLAYSLAASGKRVLIYDCDVQRSLTVWGFGNVIETKFADKPNKLSSFIESIIYDKRKFHLTLYDQVIDNEVTVKPACAQKLNKNIYAVVGDRRMPELDEKIVNAEMMSSSEFEKINYSVNMKSGRPYHAIMATANHFKIDYVLLDMNPFPSAMNRCLIMTSHYIIVPTCLDLFCLEMMHTMKNNLMEWKEKMESVRRKTNQGPFKLPDHYPKFLGYISNMFMVNKRGKSPEDIIAMNEDNWIKKEISKPRNYFF